MNIQTEMDMQIQEAKPSRGIQLTPITGSSREPLSSSRSLSTSMSSHGDYSVIDGSCDVTLDGKSQCRHCESAEPYIGPKEEACEHDVYNRHILTGYRINYNTWAVTLKSLFQCHNETINVWTHLGGFFACLVALLWVRGHELGM